ncbi:hypothetical protein PSEEN1044 [Pseudomonas entomophila L48]|uniref:Uncharacterized protein n=1 Tax=Pseudomonas entomophila (strain L48) TaxID=384676 RepID=Q1IEG0_PSEE4|nr:hypothetical protein PSEEN1044 [Pseudomonas entomophila L48]
MIFRTRKQRDSYLAALLYLLSILLCRWTKFLSRFSQYFLEGIFLWRYFLVWTIRFCEEFMSDFDALDDAVQERMLGHLRLL